MMLVDINNVPKVFRDNVMITIASPKAEACAAPDLQYLRGAGVTMSVLGLSVLKASSFFIYLLGTYILIQPSLSCISS